MHRRFTLDSARRILPVVRAKLEEAVRARQELEALRETFAAFRARAHLLGGVQPDAAAAGRWQSGMRQAAASLQASLEELQALGVQVKDLEAGLVDFPTLYRGREVLLCWRLGEPDIAWWHGLEEGFRGRKPVDEDFELHHGDGATPEA